MTRDSSLTVSGVARRACTMRRRLGSQRLSRICSARFWAGPSRRPACAAARAFGSIGPCCSVKAAPSRSVTVCLKSEQSTSCAATQLLTGGVAGKVPVRPPSEGSVLASRPALVGDELQEVRLRDDRDGPALIYGQ